MLIGYFKEFSIIIYLIVIHEIGHCLFASLFNKNILKINIYPFGGESLIDIKPSTKIIYEIIILITGPLFQLLAAYVLINIANNLDEKEIIKNINNALIVFNLLPIYSLDGGKIINNILNIFLSIKKSFEISIIISYLTIIFIIIYFNKDISLSIIYMIIFLSIKTYKEISMYNYNYNSFMLDRFLNKYHFKDKKIVENSKMYYRNKYNLVKNNDKYYTENDILIKKFGKSVDTN